VLLTIGTYTPNISPKSIVTCDSVAIRIDRQETGSCGGALSDSRGFNILSCPCAIAGNTQPALSELQLTGLSCGGVCRLDDQLQTPKLKWQYRIDRFLFASLHQGPGDLLLLNVGVCLGPRLHLLYRYRSKAGSEPSSRIPPQCNLNRNTEPKAACSCQSCIITARKRRG